MSVRVENVRFVITGGAQFSLSLGGEDQDGEAIFVGTSEVVRDDTNQQQKATTTLSDLGRIAYNIYIYARIP